MAPPFQEHALRVQDRIERHYGIAVVTRDIPDPLTGDLDGKSIHVDYLLTPEERLFLLVHLFGHTVQWNTSTHAREIAQPRKIPVPQDLLPALVAYEREAAGYALALVHEVGIQDLDQWLADYSACDEAYLLHFYRTGEKKPFRSFWRQGSRPVTAIAVPSFSLPVDAEVGWHRDLAPCRSRPVRESGAPPGRTLRQVLLRDISQIIGKDDHKIWLPARRRNGGVDQPRAGDQLPPGE